MLIYEGKFLKNMTYCTRLNGKGCSYWPLNNDDHDQLEQEENFLPSNSLANLFSNNSKRFGEPNGYFPMANGSPIAIGDDRSRKGPEAKMQSQAHSGNTPADKNPQDINWKRLDALAKGDTVNFIAGLSAELDRLIRYHESMTVLLYMDNSPQNQEVEKKLSETLSEARSEIGRRYGIFLQDILKMAEGDKRFAEALNERRPLTIQEIEIILQKIEERGDIAHPETYKGVMELSYKINAAFNEAVTGEGRGVPAPPRLARIEGRTERETAYRNLTKAIAEAFERESSKDKPSEGIIELRTRQNKLLNAAGIKDNVHDYLFLKRYGMTWQDAQKVAEPYKQRTQQQNDEFITKIAKALGIKPSEVRPWDIEYAKDKLIGAPLMLKLDEAISIIKKTCMEEFGIDPDDPKYGVVFDLENSDKHKPTAAGFFVAEVYGAKVLVANMDPNNITLDQFKSLLHETGHAIHTIIMEEYLQGKDARNYSFASTHPAVIAEAFADALSYLVYDADWARKHLPSDRFTEKYLEKFREIGVPYETFRRRRSLFFAAAARIIADPNSKIDEKRAQMVRLQGEYMGVKGDDDYAFGMPHLTNPDFDTYLMTYVLGGMFIEKMMEQNGNDLHAAIKGFKPLLELGGALTFKELRRRF